MVNRVYENGKVLKKNEGGYIIALPHDEAWEADSFMELASVVCGPEYLDCEMAETALAMRMNAAKMLGMAEVAADGFDLVFDGADGDGDEGFAETVIVYHEVIGKIPYSYSDVEVDYEIHGNPRLIRVECDETFIYSLVVNGMVAVHERTDADEYVDIRDIYDIDALMDERLAPFREKAKTKGVPLHKRLP